MFGLGTSKTRGLSAADVVEATRSAGQITVIDVRGHDEIARTGKARGAIHIPLMQLEMKADPRSPDYHAGLSQDRAVAVYCASGGRSQMATQMLRQLGYADVHNIGGFGDWAACGGEVEA